MPDVAEIAGSYRSWRETISALGAHEKPMQIAFEAGYRAALTAIMGEGDGVQEAAAAAERARIVAWLRKNHTGKLVSRMAIAAAIERGEV